MVAITGTDLLVALGCRDTHKFVLDLVCFIRGFGTADIEQGSGWGKAVVSAWLLFFCAGTMVSFSTLLSDKLAT